MEKINLKSERGILKKKQSSLNEICLKLNFHNSIVKKLCLSISVLVLLLAIINTSSGAIISPEKCKIIIPQDSNPTVNFAALELQKHLQLISNYKIPISDPSDIGKSFNFYIGIPPKDDKTQFSAEEARYRITSESVYIYGDDKQRDESIKDPLKAIIAGGRTGTLFAVYSFLENEFGVKWIEPGDNHTVFNAQATFDLNGKIYSWTPQLVRRIIRPVYHVCYEQPDMPEKLKWSQVEYANYVTDIGIWLKRMRMGGSLYVRYGHAFPTWWDKYGKTHPEYFALNEKGKREPIDPQRTYFVKMCVSNPVLHKAVVNEWWTDPKTDKNSINTCENDGEGFCTCSECKKLDADTANNSFTDRYVFFTNSILTEAKKFNPDVKATMYVYSNYVLPPRHQRLNPDVIIGFVPSMLSDFESTDNTYKLWKKAGATDMFLRPNDQHCNTGLPGGFEKRLFDAFQIGIKNNIIGVDYDSIIGYWSINGFSDYVLARAVSNPSKSFEYWEDEYCSIYGAAKDEAKEFFKYWRNSFEQKVLADKNMLIELYGHFQKGIIPKIPQYYSLEDFDRTDAILEKGAAKTLSSAERSRLDELILGNKHSRLTYTAIIKTEQAKFDAAKELLAFRIKNKTSLNIFWPGLVENEKKYGDTTGIQMVKQMGEFNNIAPTPFLWSFKIDPQNIGLKEKWQEMNITEIKKWDVAQTNINWENITRNTSQKLIEQLKNYDGIAWYACFFKIDKKWKGNKVFLYFGAVDESCWLYVNGKLAGERIYKNPEDWRTPFAIRIDQMIDWNIENQKIIVRVEDTAGNGGICQPVWLTTK